ncbi:hypothetical protein LJC24_05790 [Desulfococcaceae bacterium OttesenSCG-928-F15]|nr:hypothetical protein [Desulfococcaceae bacterium OttesenSCG-928-F15]
MYPERKNLYEALGEKRNSRVVAYITGDRPGLELGVRPEVVDFFVDHLDQCGPCPKISLYLYTRGGATLTAWSIVSLIRQYCEDFEVIVPSKCLSAGTMMAIGADRIIMTKQATLGPIDPGINTPLNPRVEGGSRLPVSVEAIRGYLELAKEELGIQGEENLTKILMGLSEKIHPLVLGEYRRARMQITMLAKRLLSRQISDPEQVGEVIRFLSSDSGSHDYTISLREAKEELGLKVEEPDGELYALIKALYEDIRAELLLNEAHDPGRYLGTKARAPYSFKRSLLESLEGGSHFFLSEGEYTRVPVPGGMQESLGDDRIFEGWRHIEAEVSGPRSLFAGLKRS